jgi:hypothetical protein
MARLIRFVIKFESCCKCGTPVTYNTTSWRDVPTNFNVTLFERSAVTMHHFCAIIQSALTVNKCDGVP